MRAVLRGIVLATLTSLLLAMAFMPAMAQDNPYAGEPTTDEGQAPESAVAGVTVTVTGDGFANGATVVVQTGGVVVTTGTVVANRGGVATARIEIPCDTAPGEVAVTMTGEGENGGERVVTTSFTVTDATAAACVEGRGLAATGANASNGLMLALGLLVVGGGAVAVSRRKKDDEVSLDA